VGGVAGVWVGLRAGKKKTPRPADGAGAWSGRWPKSSAGCRGYRRLTAAQAMLVSIFRRQTKPEKIRGQP